MFIGQGLSLEAHCAAQAERWAANTAMAATSAAAAAAAEQALSASPPFFADGLSPAIAVDWRLLSMLRIFLKGGGGGAVAHWQGNDNVRVLALARCCQRRGEDTTINIRWEVGGGRVTKGGVEVVTVRGGSNCRRPSIHCTSANH